MNFRRSFPAGLSVRASLLVSMTRREVESRYRESLIGRLWIILSPLLLLMIYTFVFGVVLKARWGSEQDTFSFALTLFSGLLLNGILAEGLSKAPGIIQSHSNYVKRVVFPLDVLPVTPVLAAAFNALLAFLVLCTVLAFAGTPPGWQALLFPLVLLPFLLLVVGLAWILAGLGVYFRDITQLVQFLLILMLFISPVFYPVSALPVAAQAWLYLNPLSVPVELTRSLLFGAPPPELLVVLSYCAASILVFWSGLVWFLRVQEGFADVL